MCAGDASSWTGWSTGAGRMCFRPRPRPPACAAANAALRIVRDEPDRRRRLLDQAERLRAALSAAGYDVGHSTSQIIPLILGDARRAVEVASELLARGLYVPAIRPPSVPDGQSRLRISLSSRTGPRTSRD